jgi:hypothetical protein
VKKPLINQSGSGHRVVGGLVGSMALCLPPLSKSSHDLSRVYAAKMIEQGILDYLALWLLAQGGLPRLSAVARGCCLPEGLIALSRVRRPPSPGPRRPL